ncbi:MAG TPA: cysteine--tRNA ligase [Dehalococcoidia bacterium]|jgi:cysteinyl-tRNA synthetase|nr:cysteine--tRNA ligase [Dehalococcoidia bacterium]
MRLTNTLAGEVQDFEPPEPGTVGLYVCGVTPYAEAHVGHAMSAIVYDVFVRYLRWKGNPHGGLVVTYVTNYTDIDDKLIERGHELGRDPLDLAQENIARWEREQQALNLIPPNVRPRVTEEIESIVNLIERIIDNDHAYATAEGNVYYRVQSKDDYGKLSHRQVDQMLTGTRFEPGDDKEFALDFSLWKATKPGEPSWGSPWGEGRPGWHIECSAMAQRYLGDEFDIHGGGLDLVFPHHENEIAQSEAANTGFARIWMHNGLVQLGGEKMAKSVGNVTTVEEALTEWGPNALRLAILGSHYHSPTTLSDDVLAAANSGGERLRTALREAPEGGEPEPDTAQRETFIEAMEDDLATPRALAVLFDLARVINSGRDAGHDVREAQGTLRELAEVLGLRLDDAPAAKLDAARLAAVVGDPVFPYNGDIPDQSTSMSALEVIVESLVANRETARSQKEFALADQIRDALAEAGVEIEDTADGPRWTARA